MLVAGLMILVSSKRAVASAPPPWSFLGLVNENSKSRQSNYGYKRVKGLVGHACLKKLTKLSPTISQK
jgi:hypothetical protein